MRKLEDAVTAPSLPALVEQGSAAAVDVAGAGAEDTPLHRVHRALKSSGARTGPGLQVLPPHEPLQVLLTRSSVAFREFLLCFFRVKIQRKAVRPLPCRDVCPL